MKRTAIYIRVSTDAQAKEGDSVPAQKEALLKYIKEWPDLTFAGEYVDDGVSGTKFEERDADAETGPPKGTVYKRAYNLGRIQKGPGSIHAGD